MTNTGTAIELLDETWAKGRQGYTLTQVHRVGDFKVRVILDRDSYVHQTQAYAGVLAADLSGWTLLVSTPPADWWAETDKLRGDAAAIERGFKRVMRREASELVERAARVLG